MPLDLRRFQATYPLLWHVTFRDNLPRIRRTRRLESAAALMRAGNDERYLRCRRVEDHEVIVDGERVVLREQGPLAVGAVEFQDGWTSERLIEEMNRRVFFWPGTADGPIRRAANNFAGFRRRPGAVILTVAVDAVLATVEESRLQFARHNVGAPRASAGKKSVRGERTFAPARDFEGTMSRVREVAVENELPLDAIWHAVTIEES